MQRGVLGPSTCFAIFAQNGSKSLKNAQKGAKRLKKALEKAVRACPVPPVRSKRLFEPASVPPVRSKRLFESAVQDHSPKKLDSATLCSAPLCSALLAPCMYMHGSILVYFMTLPMPPMWVLICIIPGECGLAPHPTPIRPDVASIFSVSRLWGSKFNPLA